MKHATSIICFVLAFSSQAERLNIPDPNFLEQYARTYRFSAGHPSNASISKDGEKVYFLRSSKDSLVQDLYEFIVKDAQERIILTAEQLLKGNEEKLSPEEKARRERTRQTARGITSYQISKDETKILIPLAGRLFVYQLANQKIAELTCTKNRAIDPRLSPDGKRVAFVRDNELFVAHIQSQTCKQLTWSSTQTITNGLAEFVAQEEMDRQEGYWWAPDSSAIAYQQSNTSGVEKLVQGQPYPRPGAANAQVRLGIISVKGGHTRWIDWGNKEYPYLATVRWTKNAPLTLLIQNREQSKEKLLAINPKTTKASILLEENDSAWINIDAQMPVWLKDGSGFLWTTERNGAWQLELHAPDGTLVRPLTQLSFGYQGFVDLDSKSQIIYLMGSDNPTQKHLYRIVLDHADSPPIQMTKGSGLYGATFADNHSVYIESSSTLDGERAQTLKDIDGHTLGHLKSVAEELPFIPNIELKTVGSNPSFHTVVVRPRNFDARTHYPVIVSAYGGPHHQTVIASSRRYMLEQWMADHGFIVVSIDGRGTPGRGRLWERAIKGNLIQTALDDQVQALQLLATQVPEMDIHRVGIFGWSFGGYFSAMAAMQRPDIFDAGVAGAPVADWADYDTHYTERYLGLPQANQEGYAKSSVLTFCEKLEKPLLLIHGTADDNVHFMHSLKISNALFRAGKSHDFLPLSDFTHMVSDPLATKRLYEQIMQFFAQRLESHAQ